jgi:spore coat protein U-like protein
VATRVAVDHTMSAGAYSDTITHTVAPNYT